MKTKLVSVTQIQKISHAINAAKKQRCGMVSFWKLLNGTCTRETRVEKPHRSAAGESLFRYFGDFN